MKRTELLGKLNRFSEKRKLPEILLLILCAVWLLYGISLKQGYHMDELLSFELANAKFNPWIVPTQPQGRLAKFVENEIEGDDARTTWHNVVETAEDVLENKGNSTLLSYKADVYSEPVWIDNRQFHDYIMVDDEDDFNYLSVYFNVKDDNHPPLHFMLLHTVSSLFKNKLTPLMGCGINLVCVLGIMMMLMWLGRKLMYLFGKKELGRLAGLWAAGLYGFSAGALSTTLLIRMYAMVSFWCVALLAVHIAKIYAPRLGTKDFSKSNKLLILVTVCGFWTQYFFLFYCLILAAVTVVLLSRVDRGHEAACYIRSMILAAVIGLVLFPFAVSDVFSSGRGVEALGNLSSGFAGYGERLVTFGKILFASLGTGAVVLPGIVLVIGLALLIVRHQIIISRGLVCLLTLPVVGYFLLAARMSPYLVDRYIMPVFPFCILFLVLVACCFADRRIACMLAVLTIIAQPAQTNLIENPYLYTGYPKQLSVSEEYAQYPCVCVGEGVGYYENLLEFTNYSKTLIVTPTELEDGSWDLKREKTIVVLIKGDTEADGVGETLHERYGMRRIGTLMDEGSVYGDRIELYGGAGTDQ